MADDNKTVPTIDELVKQLSNNTQGPPASRPAAPNPAPSQGPASNPAPKTGAPMGNPPPANLPGVRLNTPSPAPSMPKPVSPAPSMPSSPAPAPAPTKPLTPSNGAKPAAPSAPVAPAPAPAPAPVAPKAPASPTQEYRSSIRTMTEDISTLKSGKAVGGVDISRKIGPQAPAPAPVQPAPAPVKPTGPQIRVSLGKTQAAGALPTVPGVQPSKPVQMITPEMQQPVSIPSSKKSGISPLFYALIAVLLLVGGGLYWWMNQTPDYAVETPTPTMTATPTPPLVPLQAIFDGEAINYEVAGAGDSIKTAFGVFAGTASVSAGQFQKVSLVQNTNETLTPLAILDMFRMASTAYPAALASASVESITLLYGQTEHFDDAGAPIPDAQTNPTPVFVFRVSDRQSVISALSSWEATLPADLGGYMLIDPTKEASLNFLDNVYRNTNIRYKNFRFADNAIDYGLPLVNGRSYLVIAGSREAAYASIDALLGN